MNRRMTVTEVRARLAALLHDVQAGDEIEITRSGVLVARLAPARGPHALKGALRGKAVSAAGDEELFSTGMPWNTA